MGWFQKQSAQLQMPSCSTSRGGNSGNSFQVSQLPMRSKSHDCDGNKWTMEQDTMYVARQVGKPHFPA